MFSHDSQRANDAGSFLVFVRRPTGDGGDGCSVVGLAVTSTDFGTLVSTSPLSRVSSPMFPYFS